MPAPTQSAHTKHTLDLRAQAAIVGVVISKLTSFCTRLQADLVDPLTVSLDDPTGREQASDSRPVLWLKVGRSHARADPRRASLFAGTAAVHLQPSQQVDIRDCAGVQ